MTPVNARQPLGALGKLPYEVEYIRDYPPDPAFSTLLGWLAGNMAYAARRGTSGWSPAYRGGRTYAFLFRGESAATTPVAGALAPSTDSAGREFPFCIAGAARVVTDCESAPHVTPLLLEELWEQTGQLVTEAIASARLTSASASELRQRLAQAAPVEQAPAPLDDALACYRQWARELPFAELSELLYDATGHEELAAAVRLLIQAMAKPREPRMVRLPLGAAGGAAVCFWLDLAARCSGPRAARPSLFWSHDGATGDLLLVLGAPPELTLLELWLPGHATDAVWDLAHPSPSAQLGPATTADPAGLARTLTAEHASVLECLEAITASCSPRPSSLGRTDDTR